MEQSPFKLKTIFLPDKMPSIRLFIGGLSNSVAADEISKKLSSYGAIVSNLDVKEKKDLITGDVIKRFAFANIDGAESSLSNCEYEFFSP